jgi:hypothetical protein
MPALLGVRPVPSAVASGVEASVQLTVSDARGRTSDSTPTIKIQVSG